MAVPPVIITNIPNNSYISVGGVTYLKSTLNGRPSFAETKAPAGVTPTSTFDLSQMTGQGGSTGQLSAQDLLSSGTIVPKQFIGEGGKVDVNFYNQQLNETSTPRINFVPQSNQKPGIIPTGMNSEDYNALKQRADAVNPQNAGVPTRTVPSYTAPVAPARPNLINEYGNIKSQLGLSGVEGDLQTAKQKLVDTENTILAEADKIKGEQVSSVVIGRKLVKLDADTAEGLRQAKASVQLAQDQLDNKNKTLSILMGLTEKDYANVRSDWEFEYNKAIQLYTALGTEQNRQRDDARAQLAVLQKNGFDYTTATPENKSMVDSLDLQAYGRTGVTASTPPGDKEIDIYTDTNGNRIRVTQNQTTKQYSQTLIGTGLKGGDGNKSVDYTNAQTIVTNNPGESYDELFNGILQNTRLTGQEATTFLTSKGIEDVKNPLRSIRDKFLNDKALGFTRQQTLDKFKTDKGNDMPAETAKVLDEVFGPAPAPTTTDVKWWNPLSWF